MNIVKKVNNRLIQHISQLELIDRYFKQKYDIRVSQHSNKLPNLSSCSSRIVDELNQKGVCVSHLTELNIGNSQQLLESCSKIASQLMYASPKHKNSYFIKATGEQISQYPDIFLWGLNNKLLDIIENYLSLPVASHGIYLRRDLANGIVKRSRLWHLDKEDRKILKIIVYLNDVSDRNGAFQYIPRQFTPHILQKQWHKYQYLKEEKMKSILPASELVSCPGKKGTVIFVDTANVFHHGMLPQESERLAIFFDYTSVTPWRFYYCKTIFSLQQLRTFAPLLSQRQKHCVFWNNKLKKMIEH